MNIGLAQKESHQDSNSTPNGIGSQAEQPLPIWLQIVLVNPKLFYKKVLKAKFQIFCSTFFHAHFCVFTGIFFDFFHVHSFSFHVCLLRFFFTCKNKFSRALFDAILDFFTCTFFFSRPKSRKSQKFSRVSFFFHAQKNKNWKLPPHCYIII